MSELRNTVDDLPQLKVLVVDDKPNMRRTVRNMMRSFGFSHFTDADDGDVAYRMLKSEKFDLVVCDWNMPRMKGVELLKTLRQDGRFDDMPFLMITGEVEEPKVAEAIEAAVDSYIIKPFQIGTLEDKLVEIMSKRRTPSALDVQFQLVEVCLKTRDYGRAHKELDAALTISRKSPRLYYYRGLVFEAEGKIVEAEKCFLAARKLGPLFIKAHEKLAGIYESRGRTDEAARLLLETVNISPNNAARQLRLGKALLAEGRVPRAMKAFLKAIELDRHNHERRIDIGRALLDRNLVEEAETIFRGYVEDYPSDTEAYNNLGIALRRAGKHEEAVRYYQKALEIEPEEQYLHFNLARVLVESKRRELAVDHLRRALRIQPDFEEARLLLNKLIPAKQ